MISPTPKVLTEADLAGLPRAVRSEDALIERLNDECDLCNNEGAEDIATLLAEAIGGIRALVSERDALAGRVAELERDAKRWEMLAYMHTRGVTFHVYEHYIGNPDRLDYAATLHREYLSGELARAALSATTPESKP